MKTALITGGSRGIGSETVKIFAQQGYRVFLNYNNSHSSAQKLQTQLTSQGFDVHLLKADVSDETQVCQMLDYIKTHAKRLDVLVNNAGTALYQQVQDTTIEQYNSVMDVNCKGMFLVTKYAVPLMLQNFSGNITNISSIWGLVGASCESIYSMSKFAVVGFSLSLDKELCDSGINTNCICPPLVLTDMCKNLTADDIRHFEKTYGKLVTPQEVATKIFEVSTSDKSGEIIKM